MNKYETVFILTPVLSDDQMKETVEKFKKVLTDNGGNIENEENWGLRKLAYPIENKNTGFYTLIEFEGDPTLIAKLETAYRRDEKVIRFLTFRLDKYAAEYAVKRRAVRKAKQEERAAQEAAAAQEAPVVAEAPQAEEAPAAEA
ncbi:MAG: 30S ribosomal protein S6 [Muribaculaceae bacterium]|jgi:small subunit ribosomal protein S6|nr:30S ribosomal protein S6 [Muribaculaceae bacterium]